jgi:hypothetical protein
MKDEGFRDRESSGTDLPDGSSSLVSTAGANGTFIPPQSSDGDNELAAEWGGLLAVESNAPLAGKRDRVWTLPFMVTLIVTGSKNGNRRRGGKRKP